MARSQGKLCTPGRVCICSTLALGGVLSLCLWYSDLYQLNLASNLPDISSFQRRGAPVSESLILPNGSLRKRSFEERLRYLERKVDGSLNWLKDPHMGSRIEHRCKNQSSLGTDHHICLDKWGSSGKPCVVYDLGIRANPEFGVTLGSKYACKVRAYDPSAISRKWWRDSSRDILRQAKDYRFYNVGAAGVDGKITLFSYNWDQVSIVKAEQDLTLPKEMLEKQKTAWQSEFRLPAKTLPTMLEDNGDSFIDVLKIDIEGSEYPFLQDIFDRMGCPPVGQITIEWHHFSIDERYGTSPEINALHLLLNDCGFKQFYWRTHWRNWVTEKDKYYIPPKRYTLTSYCKSCY